MFLAAFHNTVRAAQSTKDLFFAGLLTKDDIRCAAGSTTADSRRWIYSPLTTIHIFLSQCLSIDHSCREAVARFMAWKVKNKLPASSADTGAYCVARNELSQEHCHALARNEGRKLDKSTPKGWKWKSRDVYVVDGSTLTMPDTPANQAQYPQESQQKPGLGFPIARIIVVFSLAVGTAIEMSIGNYKGKQTGENTMLRQMLGVFEAGDVLLTDRAYAGWFDIVLASKRGVDVITRKQPSRKSDFRSGKRLGKDDHIVSFRKPKRPEWMDKETYDSLPTEFELRQVRIHVAQKGFRTKEIIVETTLLDHNEYTKEDLGRAFRRRWDAELHLRSLKTVLQMAHLRCKTPHRVHNEFYMHLLAYNLIRKVIAFAAEHAGVQPYQISYKGALQTLMNFLYILAHDTDPKEWCTRLLVAIATHEEGNRPDRVEPRVKKRRSTKYPKMTKPRQEYKKQWH